MPSAQIVPLLPPFRGKYVGRFRFHDAVREPDPRQHLRTLVTGRPDRWAPLFKETTEDDKNYYLNGYTLPKNGSPATNGSGGTVNSFDVVFREAVGVSTIEACYPVAAAAFGLPWPPPERKGPDGSPEPPERDGEGDGLGFDPLDPNQAAQAGIADGLGEWDAGEDNEPIPPRQWLLGNIFCLGFLSSLFGEGGVGKTRCACCNGCPSPLAAHCWATMSLNGGRCW
jgi:hypothetical protein